jgi:lipoprotein-anchoring transpeptidase ErfK/SrfK
MRLAETRTLIVRRLATAAGSLVLATTLVAIAPALAHADTSATFGGDVEALNAANSISAAGILTGWDSGKGVLEDYVTRGELAVMLARALGLKDADTQHFDDVTRSQACFGAVGALYEAGLIEESTATVFAPDELVNRRRAVLWIVNALGYKVGAGATDPVPYRLSFLESADVWLQGFRDRQLIGADCARAVANAYRLGIVDAASDGWFYPTIGLSWGDAVIMLDRAFVEPVAARTSPPEALPAAQSYPLLEPKDEGPLVWYLEYQLTSLKYVPGNIDGKYDTHTRDAVLAFEKVERIKRTGSMTVAAWQKLPTAQTPLPKKTEAGSRVEIDLTRQVLLLITDNKVWKIVHCSTGISSRRTHTGHFAIQEKYTGWVICVTVNGMMYSPSYVVSKTAIHGYRSVPPYPASHGCIRVPVWMAEDIFNETPTGTTVDIYY